jgi:hypothetical protein
VPDRAAAQARRWRCSAWGGEARPHGRRCSTGGASARRHDCGSTARGRRANWPTRHDHFYAWVELSVGWARHGTAGPLVVAGKDSCVSGDRRRVLDVAIIMLGSIDVGPVEEQQPASSGVVFLAQKIIKLEPKPAKPLRRP